MLAQGKTFKELFFEYHERFGECFGVPFGADFTNQDAIDEMTYSLETGIPFDQNSPRWRWSAEPLPDGVVI